MAIVWSSLLVSSGLAEEFEQVTLKLLSRRPSALPRFEEMCGGRVILLDVGDKLQRICDQVRTEQSPSESSPAYVPIRPPSEHLSVLIPPFFTPVNQSTPSHSFSFLLSETTPFEIFYCTRHGLMSGESVNIYIHVFCPQPVW